MQTSTSTTNLLENTRLVYASGTNIQLNSTSITSKDYGQRYGQQLVSDARVYSESARDRGCFDTLVRYSARRTTNSNSI
jgi:hypothetical protein